MVYYFTSRNVKLLQGLMEDYRAFTELTPHEYLNDCFRNESMEDSKISWVLDVFLGVHKHNSFLKKIAREAAMFPAVEEDYFIIITYGIVFKVSPKNTLNIFKCMYNLSKHLLNAFVKFYSSKDNVANVSRIAMNEYDTFFVTEKIIDPLLSWQPFLLETTKTCNKYLNKRQFCNQKSSTTSLCKITRNRSHGTKGFTPNSTPIKVKVVTNNKIRQYNPWRNRKQISRPHVNKMNSNFDNFMEKITNKESNFKDLCKKLAYKNMNSYSSFKETSVPKTKTTKAVVKRLNNTVKKCEVNELKWLYDIVDNCENTLKAKKLIEYDREESKKERLENMKRNHLMGQISHEEAAIAKKEMLNEKKKKYIEFIREKKIWEKEMQDWKIKHTEYNRKQIEKMSLVELNLIDARNTMLEKRKENAEIVRYDTKVLKEVAMKNKEAEIERRINVIKEIKTLHMFAKNSRMQRTVDLNETPGLGLLCEMSIGELQNKLADLKVTLQGDLEEKKNKIRTLNDEKKQELEEAKKSNAIFTAEKERMRNLKKIRDDKVNISTNEISNLERMLEMKRNQRMLLSKQTP